MGKIAQVRKRDGRLVAYNETKIADAIFKAAQAVGGQDRQMADDLASVVTMFLEREFDGRIPGIEDIQDVVERVLIETGHARTAKAYILYREKRARRRESLRVRRPVRDKVAATDITLLVDPGTRDELLPWDRGRIAAALVDEAQLDDEVAHDIARAVERKVFDSGIDRISTSLIRELVDNELFERGMSAKLERQKSIGIPKYDLEELIFSKSKENSNIGANNPEAINLSIAETTLKQYALQEVFSREVADAHLAGAVHLHDLGYPTRVYCSSHSLEYIKKYGLSLCNLDTASAPAKHARTLTGHLNTFLASMQAYYAGALGVGYINILYAPYVEGMSYKEMCQEAQHLIFSGSQSAFSRGGQTLFLDFNIHTGVPRYLWDVPAVGPGGKYTGKTYGEYAETARLFTRAMLDTWRAGDEYGHIFAFPKCDLHINADTFSDPEQLKLLEYACLIASENGVPYFVFDRDEVTLSACCRLRTTIEDTSMIKRLETMRFCGFQNVTINLPQAAYRAGRGNISKFIAEVEAMMDIAVQAHLQKRTFIAKLMSTPAMPLWQIGKPAMDGKPYVELDKCTYIIGLIGLNEAIQFLTGEELHESDQALKLGLKVVSHMHFKAKSDGKRLGLKISLEESPAESATRRLAKVDLRDFPNEARQVVKGNIELDEYYYTNSIHLRADAPVDIVTRIRLQSKFHPMIESGAIVHAFVGEELPPPAGVQNLVRKTYEQTRCAQMTISPEFTVCNACHRMEVGLHETCPTCASPNVYGLTRIVGYYSRITNWNKSKLGELRDRRRGRYALPTAETRVRESSLV